MFVPRVFSRVSRNACRSYRLLPASQSPQHLPSHGHQSPDNLIPVPFNLLHLTINASSTPRALFFSTSPIPDGKEHGDIGSSTSADSTKTSEEAKGLGSEVDFSWDGREFVVENFAKGLLDVVAKLRTMSFIGNDKFSKIDASKGLDGAAPQKSVAGISKFLIDDPSKGLDGAVLLLKTLRECLEGAEKQVAEVVKKCDEFDPESESCGPDRDAAVLELENFAKGLVDVANNLERASFIAKDKFSNIDAFKKSNEVLPILKTLLEAVEMTEKQLDEVLEKLGLEKFDSKQEPYNPDKHHAIIQFPVNAQPPGTIIAVLKAGYRFHGRMFRRAEVATTREVTEQDRLEDDDITCGLSDDYGESESQSQRTG